jgi:hypothetical protein
MRERITAGLAAEIALWAATTAAFLGFYLGAHDGPPASLAPHLRVVGTLLAAVMWGRFAAWRYAGDRLGGVLVTLLWGLGFGGLALFYLSNWIALEHWGRILSLALLQTYVAQADALLEALGIAPAWAILAATLSLTGFLGAVHALFGRRDWIRPLARRGRPGFVGLMLALAACGIGLSAWDAVAFTPATSGEPVALTLRPTEVGRTPGGHAPASSRQLDTREQEARAAYLPRTLERPPNLILIVVDALRADRLTANGAARDTMPHLDRRIRAGSATSVPHAWAVCAESACGLMAIAASRPPHRMPVRPITLQEVLRLHGYAAHMILSGDHTHFYGLRAAYGTLDSYVDGSMGSRSMNDDRLVIDRLETLARFSGKPTFLQLHLMSAHPLARRDDAQGRFQPQRSYVLDKLTGPGRAATAAPNPAYLNFYDNGAAAADRFIDRILDLLAQRGYLDDAVVAITADHGELIGEHGQYGHTRTVHDAVLRIPMVFMRFGPRDGGPLASGAMASQVDIAPTLLREAGITVPATWSGRALQTGSDAAGTRREVLFQQGAECGLVDAAGPSQRWKYILDTRSGRERVYELVSDPGELRDLAAETPAAMKRAWRARLREPETYAREQRSGG